METSASSALWIALAAVALFVALAQTARLAWARVSRTWAVQTRARRALDGERRAEGMLERAGYRVLERQTRGSWTVYADGEPVEVGLRADLLVARGGRRYVAEVKTGKLAPRLDHAATRRQLLEYRMVFGVDGVLLVDAEAGRVVAVDLGEATGELGERGARGSRAFPLLLAGTALGVGVVTGWLLHG